MPALGFSLFLLAVGAILAFAVNVTVTGISIATVGVILMIVGIAAMAFSMLFWTSFAPFGSNGRYGSSSRRDVTVSRRDGVDDDVVVERRDVHVRHDPT